jgi:UDPglucose--hexose-1-phosphate uridylyltransferase
LPELRRDPILGRWVIVSTERNRRPRDFNHGSDAYGSIPCPFCPGNEAKTPPEVLSYGPPNRPPNSTNWWLRVVPNKFPVLEIEGQLHRAGEGMYDRMDGLGAHEVIIETPDHDRQMEHLEDARIEDVFWSYRDRIVDLKKDPRLEYVLIFKNRGEAAGAKLTHNNSQLIATPMVPIRVKQEMQGAAAYFEYKERCIFCDIVRQEQMQKVRLIDENDHFIAIAPFASRFPFETWILPKKHDHCYEDIEKPEMSQLARMMKSVLRRLDGVLEEPSYSYVIHNSPLKANFLEHYHWHIEIVPKLTRTAGFEWGTGFYVNPTPPEHAAAYLREMDSVTKQP